MSTAFFDVCIVYSAVGSDLQSHFQHSSELQNLCLTIMKQTVHPTVKQNSPQVIILLDIGHLNQFKKQEIQIKF